MSTEKKAQKYLAEHEDVQQVFSTTDGFMFLKKIHARAHGITLVNKEVSTHKRANVVEKAESKGLLDGNLTEVKQRVATVEDIELLEALILQEHKEANRKGALEALADRIEELNPVTKATQEVDVNVDQEEDQNEPKQETNQEKE